MVEYIRPYDYCQKVIQKTELTLAEKVIKEIDS